jgi:hypothetical protein
MNFAEKYNKVITGLVAGFVFPFVVGLITFIFTHKNNSLSVYLSEVVDSHIVTHAITLCVFPNILIFLLFNRYDMLDASKGILAITIAWALVVFGVKFL